MSVETTKMMELWGAVPRGEGKADLWTRIGTAFQNRDGSWNLRLNFFPLDPRTTVQMREPRAAGAE